MVQVISTTPARVATSETVCMGCGATLLYTKNDVRTVHGLDYSGGADGCEYIVCPNCDHRVIIRAW